MLITPIHLLMCEATVEEKINNNSFNVTISTDEVKVLVAVRVDCSSCVRTEQLNTQLVSFLVLDEDLAGY